MLVVSTADIFNDEHQLSGYFLVMGIKEYTTTKEGVEMQFGVNHLGHFLLTNLLMEKIFAAGTGARIINVSSLGYMTARLCVDWNLKVICSTEYLILSSLLTEKIEKGIQSLAGLRTVQDRKYSICVLAWGKIEK